MTTRDFDVLIIGAGISGIGAAYHLKTRRRRTSFAVLEGRDSIGGTWSLFRYPGIRSDSDMPIFGFGFKPWTHRKAIADGHIIMEYLQQTVTENGLAEHIRFGHRVLRAAFSSPAGRWTVTAQHGDEAVTFTARFLFLGTGYACRKILGGNAGRLYRFDLDALVPVAAKIGPTVAEVHTPLEDTGYRAPAAFGYRPFEGGLALKRLPPARR
jgi:NAD(P)-binding Rossmann-like domain